MIPEQSFNLLPSSNAFSHFDTLWHLIKPQQMEDNILIEL